MQGAAGGIERSKIMQKVIMQNVMSTALVAALVGVAFLWTPAADAG